MTDKVQPGVRIDAALWEEFRENINERKGGVRGHLQTELENAIQDYINHGTEQTVEGQLREFNERLYRIEETVGTTATDGAGDTFGASSHTHAPSRVSVDGKPSANAATEKKVAYLADCLLTVEETTREQLVSLSIDSIRDVVKDEYGFRSDTARRYVEELIDWFDLREHPRADGIYVTDEQYRTLTEQELDDLDEAEK